MIISQVTPNSFDLALSPRHICQVYKAYRYKAGVQGPAGKLTWLWYEWTIAIDNLPVKKITFFATTMVVHMHAYKHKYMCK